MASASVSERWRDAGAEAMGAGVGVSAVAVVAASARRAGRMMKRVMTGTPGARWRQVEVERCAHHDAA